MYKVGVIGCGRMGGFIDDERADYMPEMIPYSHAAAYAQEPRTTIVAAADPNQDALKRFSERYGVERLYQDYSEMLAKEKLDIVSVTTHTPIHAPATIAAAESGAKGVYCEKAMACSLEEADRMIEACEKHNVRLTIGHSRRWLAHFTHVKKLLEEGVIGELRTVVGYCGGSLIHSNSHAFDLYNMWVGSEPVFVMGYLEADADPPEVTTNRKDVAGNGFIQYANGVTAFLCGNRRSFFNCDFDLVGTDGTIRSVANGRKVEVCKRAIQMQDWWPWGPRIVEEVKVPAAEKSPTAMAIAELIDCIESGKETCSNGYAGRLALEIGLAFHESYRLGGARVVLPLHNRKLSVHSR